MASIYWLIAFVIFVGIEIATMALTTIWFAGGAFVAFLLALAGVGVEAQLAVFVVVSFLLLFMTRPLAHKYINKNTIKTNVDSLIGETARVTAEINNEKSLGTAVVKGQEWTARSWKDEECYQAGTMVEVIRIDGVKLIVAEKKEAL